MKRLNFDKEWCVNIYKLQLCYDIHFDCNIKSLLMVFGLVRLSEGIGVHALGVTMGFGWTWNNTSCDKYTL